MMTSYINHHKSYIRLIYQSEYIFLIAFFADRASQLVCTAASIVTAKSILSPFLGRCPAHLKKSWNGWYSWVVCWKKNMWNIVEFQSMARPCCRITWLQPLMILACGYESRKLSWSFWEGSPHDLVHAKRIPGCKQVFCRCKEIFRYTHSYLHG